MEEFNHTLYYWFQSPVFCYVLLVFEDFFSGPFFLYKFLKSKFLWKYFKLISDLIWINDFIWHKMEVLMTVNVNCTGHLLSNQVHRYILKHNGFFKVLKTKITEWDSLYLRHPGLGFVISPVFKKSNHKTQKYGRE